MPRPRSRANRLRRRHLRARRIELSLFERLVAEAIDSIPEPFLSKLESVAVVIEQRPSPELLRSLGMPPGETLLGLYEGTPLTERGESYNLAPPDRIIIFRLPILEMCGTAEEVIDEVRRTVLHEVAHFYGMSDEELDRMGFS